MRERTRQRTCGGMRERTRQRTRGGMRGRNENNMEGKLDSMIQGVTDDFPR
jgi:hypothetical protein